MRTQKGMAEQCKDPSQNKEQQRNGGRVQTRKETKSRGSKRPMNSERVEFKLGDREITSIGNKRPDMDQESAVTFSDYQLHAWLQPMYGLTIQQSAVSLLHYLLLSWSVVHSVAAQGTHAVY